MGDRTTCTLKLYGPVPRSVLELIDTDVEGLEYHLHESIGDGAFTATESYADAFDAVTPYLIKHGFAWRFEQAGYTGSYPATASLWTQESGELIDLPTDGEHICIQVEGVPLDVARDRAEGVLRALEIHRDLGPLTVVEDVPDDVEEDFAVSEWIHEVHDGETATYADWLKARRAEETPT